MRQAIARFLEEPTGRRFLTAWKSLTKSRKQVDFARLRTLLSQGKTQSVRDYLEALPQWLRLSPRVQELAVLVAEMEHDPDEAELSRFLFATCLEGILAAGDGSPENPYLAVQPADEAAVLAVLGREPASQALVESKGRCLDVILCRDGGEVCFDVTHILRPTSKSGSRRPKQPALAAQTTK